MNAYNEKTNKIHSTNSLHRAITWSMSLYPWIVSCVAHTCALLNYISDSKKEKINLKHTHNDPKWNEMVEEAIIFSLSYGMRSSCYTFFFKYWTTKMKNNKLTDFSSCVCFGLFIFRFVGPSQRRLYFNFDATFKNAESVMFQMPWAHSYESNRIYALTEKYCQIHLLFRTEDAFLNLQVVEGKHVDVMITNRKKYFTYFIYAWTCTLHNYPISTNH